MANPRQRRKAKSGTNKVRQSRRQQDKLKKIIVQGPPSLVKQWDVRKTARQNYDTLGLSLKRPLALRQSGGTEKHDEDLSLFGKMDEDANDESSEEEDDNSDEEDEKAAKEAAAARPPSNTTSRDIPKGFARIERDAQGNVIRVVMSAFDEDDDNDEQLNESGQGKQQQEQEDTPWGVPLNREEETRRAAAPIQPVIAKNAAIRELELASEEEAKNKAPRFSSNGEADVLARLVRKYGDDIGAMSRDIKLNRDQRTAGQLKKAVVRAGGIDKLKQVPV